MTRSGRLAIICAVAALPACGRSTPAPDAADIAANNRGVGLMGMYKYDEADDVFRALAAEHADWVDVNVNFAIAMLRLANNAARIAFVDPDAMGRGYVILAMCAS